MPAHRVRRVHVVRSHRVHLAVHLRVRMRVHLQVHLVRVRGVRGVRNLVRVRGVRGVRNLVRGDLVRLEGRRVKNLNFAPVVAAASLSDFEPVGVEICFENVREGLTGVERGGRHPVGVRHGRGHPQMRKRPRGREHPVGRHPEWVMRAEARRTPSMRRHTVWTRGTAQRLPRREPRVTVQ